MGRGGEGGGGGEKKAGKAGGGGGGRGRGPGPPPPVAEGAAAGAGPPAIPHRQVMLMERSKSPKPARAGNCGRARSGALPCAGLPAVTVSSAVSPKLSQLPSGASH